MTTTTIVMSAVMWLGGFLLGLARGRRDLHRALWERDLFRNRLRELLLHDKRIQ